MITTCTRSPRRGRSGRLVRATLLWTLHMSTWAWWSWSWSWSRNKRSKGILNRPRNETKPSKDHCHSASDGPRELGCILAITSTLDSKNVATYPEPSSSATTIRAVCRALNPSLHPGCSSTDSCPANAPGYALSTSATDPVSSPSTGDIDECQRATELSTGRLDERLGAIGKARGAQVSLRFSLL